MGCVIGWVYFLLKEGILGLFRNLGGLVDVRLGYGEWVVVYGFGGWLGLVI